MNLKIMRVCLILILILVQGKINAQSFFQDSIEIEEFVQVDFCGPDYGERDSLTVDVSNPKTLEMLLDYGLYTCFTGFEEQVPILSYLTKHIYAIQTELIISRIKSKEYAYKHILYLELLREKLKSIPNPNEIILFEEDFDHLEEHDQAIFKDIIRVYSIKLK